MIIIGIGAKARNGKDTAGEAIKAYYDNQTTLLKQHGLAGGLKVSIMKFATALYQEVNDFLASDTGKRWLSRENRPATFAHILSLPEWVTPESNPEVTPLMPYGKHPKLLQWWGTEFRRAQDPDYWVKKAFASIPPGTNVVVFTDVRFNNEAESIKSRGGHLIEVTRLNQDGTQYYATDRPSDHQSETELDGYNWDHYIKTKYAAETAEQAVTIAEFIRTLETK